VGDGWRGDQEYSVDRLSGSDETNGDRTSPGDDVVRGEDPLTSSDQYAGLEEVDADVQDQDWGNEEGEEMAAMLPYIAVVVKDGVAYLFRIQY